MAKENVADDTEAPAKKRRASGPRQAKPINVLFRVTDRDGNAIEGAQLNVIYAGKNTDDLLAAMDSHKDAVRTKLTF